MPYELRPEPHPTLRPEEAYLQTTWARSVYPMAEALGVPIVLPDVSPQPHTRLAFEGYQFARAHGAGEAYNHRMFTAFFQESLNIGQLDVLTRLAGEVGLDPGAFRQALETGKYRQAHAEALRHAYEEAAITAVPTFVIGERVMPGIQSKETLEAAIAAARRA